MTKEMIPVSDWALRVFKEHAPSQTTLNRWAARAYIQPAPKKIARRWFVSPEAEYVGEQIKPAVLKNDSPALKRILGYGSAA